MSDTHEVPHVGAPDPELRNSPVFSVSPGAGTRAPAPNKFTRP